MDPVGLPTSSGNLPEGPQSTSERSNGRRSPERSYRSRSRSRSRERHGGGRYNRGGRDRSTERNERREREENDKKFNVDEGEKELRSVFVRNLPLKAKTKDIIQFFEEKTQGKVREVRMIQDKHSAKHKGMGYIEFYQKETVMTALVLNRNDFWGKTIEVSGCEKHALAAEAAAASQHAAPAKPVPQYPTKLYVGNLHTGVTEEMLRNLFSAFGDIEWTKVVRDQAGVSEGYGFVNFRYPDDMKYAQSDLQGREVAGKPLVLGYVAEESAGGRGEAMIAEAQLTAQAPPNLPEPNMFGMMEMMGYQPVMEQDSERLDDDDFKVNASSRASLMAKLSSRDADGTALVTPSLPGHPKVGGGLAGYPGYPQAAIPGMVVPQAGNIPTAVQSSNCILLKNMFNPHEETDNNFDLEIAGDVREECGKYGPVLHIFVDKFTQGFVYLKFGSVDAAKRAVGDLNGRWFAGKQISAVFLDANEYAQKFPQS